MPWKCCSPTREIGERWPPLLVRLEPCPYGPLGKNPLHRHFVLHLRTPATMPPSAWSEAPASSSLPMACRHYRTAPTGWSHRAVEVIMDGPDLNARYQFAWFNLNQRSCPGWLVFNEVCRPHAPEAWTQSTAL
jgi:hypothetical protein